MSALLLAFPLALSMFTCLWNPIGFPSLLYDEVTYLGRAMHTLLFNDLQQGTLYDHPYFGQLLLAGILSIIGYPGSLNPSAHGNVVHSVELLWLVPRSLMGIFAVLDNLLIFKICENRYNTTVALIASVLFAVMPTVSFLRTVFLESLLLPLLLSSIMFAVYGKSSAENNNKKNEIMLLLSGLLLGLAIFTKISAFLMIPVVIYIIYTNNNRRWKPWAIWFAPLFLIPLIWPLYAVVNGQFDNWWNGVYWQTHRQVAGAMEVDKEKTLSNTLISSFLKMPFWILAGFAGLILAAMRRDLFPFLWIIPFLVFLNIIGFVRDFHLVPLLPAFCISAAILIVELSYRIICNEKIRRVLQFSIISTIAIFGLANITTLLVTSNNDDKIAASAFVTRYLNDNQHANLTVVSNHVYEWIPKYVLQLRANYMTETDPIWTTPKSENVLFMVDGAFKNVLKGNDEAGEKLRKLFNIYYTNETAVVNVGRDKIVLPQRFSQFPEQHTINLIDEEHMWKSYNNASLLQRNGILTVLAKNNHTDGKFKVASLETELTNPKETPLILVLDYGFEQPKDNAQFILEIREKDAGNKVRLKVELQDDVNDSSLFILPNDITGKTVEFRLSISDRMPGEYMLNMKKAMLTFG
jgi:hypothetical protein